MDCLRVKVRGVGKVSGVLLASCQKCHDVATYSFAVEWMRRMLSPGKICTREPKRSVTPVRSMWRSKSTTSSSGLKQRIACISCSFRGRCAQMSQPRSCFARSHSSFSSRRDFRVPSNSAYLESCQTYDSDMKIAYVVCSKEVNWARRRTYISLMPFGSIPGFTFVRRLALVCCSRRYFMARCAYRKSPASLVSRHPPIVCFKRTFTHC